MLRSILAIFSGFAAWGIVCLVVNQVLFAAMPEAFHDDGTTDSAPILAFLLVMSVLYPLLPKRLPSG